MKNKNDFSLAILYRDGYEWQRYDFINEDEFLVFQLTFNGITDYDKRSSHYR